MSKQIERIPRSKIARIENYINTDKKTVAQVVAEKSAEYGGTVYGFNVAFFDMATYKPVPLLKKDGVILTDIPWNCFGLGWNDGPDIKQDADISKYRNYSSGVELITPYGPVATVQCLPEVRGVRGRTAWGYTETELVYFCSKDGTADALDEYALRDWGVANGMKAWVMADGGLSSQCAGPNGVITGGRPVYHMILIYLKKEAKPCMDCREKLVTTALAELGVSAPTGDDKYISWYNRATGSNFALNVAWCAIFVSWCARAAGICAPLIPNYAGCTTAMKTFKSLGTWRDWVRNGYTPRRGDLIFFDWDADSSMSEHTGIVTGVSGGYVHTVEGNTGSGSVSEKSYMLTSANVLGYVNWDASDVETAPTGGTGGGSTGNTGSTIKDIQHGLNVRYNAGLAEDGSWGPASKKAYTKALQAEINRSFSGKLVVDGSWGPASKTACPALVKGAKGGMVWLLQAGLTVNGYPVVLDESFGPATETAVNRFKPTAGLKADGIADGNTFAALLK